MQRSPNIRTASKSSLPLMPKRRRGERGPDRKPRKIRSDAATCISSIDAIIRDASHNANWLSSMRAAKELAPRCTHIKPTGIKCERVAMKGSAFCCRHIPFDQLRKIDEVRYQKAQDIIDRIASPTIVSRARRVQLVIEKRRLLFLWAKNGANQPETQGATLFLHPGDSAAVANHLKHYSGVDIFTDKMTPRAVDRCRWAAFHYLVGKIDASSYERRVACALRQDAKYWFTKTS